jgi:hypothetical protein
MTTPRSSPGTVQWEARSKLRWGSEHQGFFKSGAAARAFAQKEIEKHGGVGRIEAISSETRTVYYDIHKEIS